MSLPSPTCASCAAPLAAGQRYCLECGERHGDPRLDPLAHARGPGGAGPSAPAPAPGGLAGPGRVPGARAAGLLTLGMLVAGFALGTVGQRDSTASSAGVARPVILLAGPPALGALPPSPAAPAAAPVAEIPEPEVEESEGEPALPEPPAPSPEPLPDVGSSGEPDDDAVEETPVPPAAPRLPPVEHVWVISLADRGLATTFGAGSGDAYLREQLVREGVLLNNYHATARGTLANGVALLSGQGANPATEHDCSQPAEVSPGTVAPEDDLGQVRGEGCVYPTTVGTLPEQLTATGRSWRAYVEDVQPGRLSTTPGCEAARTPRNPFAYFKAIADAPDCPERIVGTDALGADLADPARTPTLSWIVPDACHDGRETPCAPGAPAGLAVASAWLRPVVDQIRATKAYRDGGLIVLLADRAPQDGPSPDTSARKGAPEGQGGGLVPVLLLSPFVTPGQQVAAAYDHFSLLGTLEDLFSLDRLGQARRAGLKSFGPRVFGAFSARAG